MKQRIRTITALAFVVLLANPFTIAPAAALFGEDTDVLSPNAKQVVKNSDSISDHVVNYGKTESRPGWFVELESSEDIKSLDSWANGSDTRTVLDYYNSTNTALIAAEGADITDKGWSVSDLFGSDALAERGYVVRITPELSTEYVEPIYSLDSNRSHEFPNALWYAKARTIATDSSYDKTGMAWDEDANRTNLSAVPDLVGASSVQANGTGVDVAVIDSGTNFANGTQFGINGSGSAFRVQDAYDFVEGESVNLSVDRRNVTEELEAVSDPNGHGTWVSTAVVGNDGIAPGADLMAYRALNGEGKGKTSDIAAAIYRADREGADVLVMSLGSPIANEQLKTALEHALGPNGNVTAAYVAAGNAYMSGGARYVSSPGDVSEVITVQATNNSLDQARKAYFGEVGPDPGTGAADKGVSPDIAAPGMSITANTPDYGDGVTTTSDSTLSGTSMAAPIAAGAGVITLDARESLRGDSEKFHEVVVNSGYHLTHLGVTESRGGMANASRAINGWSEDAPDRNLTDAAKGRDAGNQVLSGNTGQFLAGASSWTSSVSEGIPYL